jgi:hypothetical protein
MLVIRDQNSDGATATDRLIWKWLRGTATAQADFGDPTDGTDYTLCVYTGLTPEPVMETTISAGAGWSPISTKGYKFKDKTTAQDGVRKIMLKGGRAGRAKAMVLGKGANLRMTPSLLPLDESGPVITQLINNTTSACWETRFSSSMRNTQEMYQARTP